MSPSGRKQRLGTEQLGARNWVLFDAMDLNRISKVVEKSSAEEAEQELISYFKEENVLKRMITRLNRFPDMRPRLDLLRKAECDYLEERYYSSAFVTISVMDGFVNDAFKENRRGLHARDATEMYADDCIASVWEGLPSIQATFSKSICKRIDDPIYEVYRNGIMHGMTTNFDNDVVASKAWCMLFAIGDWVEAKQDDSVKRKTQYSPAELLTASIELDKKNRKNKKMLDEWKEHNVDLTNPTAGDRELVDTCKAFFEAWRSKNYGKLGTFLPNFIDRTPGALAGEARKYFSSHEISEFDIEEIDRPAPAIAVVKARLNSTNDSWVVSLRFSRFSNNNPAADWEPGEWKVMRYAVDPFRDAGE